MDLEEQETDEHYLEEDRLFSDYYTIKPPLGNSGIYTNGKAGNMEYVLFEPFLSGEEAVLLKRIKSIIVEKENIPYEVIRDDEKIERYLKDLIGKEFKRYKRKFPPESKDKLEYYILRDFLGYGSIDLLIHDDNIEDVSCNGLDVPIYVWHRHHESIPTNIIYESEEELRSIIIRLAYKAGVQISVANPIVEGTLPNGFRIHLTLREVSTKGHTFTIRKHKRNPFTLVDLIRMGTISIKIGAYLWFLIENERNIMISGSTGSGKTTLLNSICTFIKPEHKVITIEEVRELNLHQNWIPMVTRTSFQTGLKDITLFDLLKSALRQRPDFLILGEVRGEEAYTLFQAIATGHGGICSIHSESVEATIKRLRTRPLNIPDHIIPLMNVIVQIRRTQVDNDVVRRVTDVAEIVGNEQDGTPTLRKRFTWDPRSNSFKFNEPDPEDSYLMQKISESKQVPVENLLEEFERKQIVLKWMTREGINSYDGVAGIIRGYYLNPEEVYQRARLEV